MSDDLRASDEDRDRVAAVLAEALATGRLTSLEHADRLDAAYTAKTVGELVPITGDLPEVKATQAPQVEQQTIQATFGKTLRKGRWVASRHTTLRPRFGALVVDLSEAVLPGREITLECSPAFSKLIVRVPDNAQVIDEGSTVFGKRNVSGGTGGGDGPVIRITGRASFSKLIVARGVTDWNLQ